MGEPGTRRTIWLKIGIGAAVVVLLLAAGGFAALKLTDSPAFCGRCHEMKPFYNAWRAGPHHDASCTSCHEDRALLPYLKRKIWASKEVWVHLLGRPEFPLGTVVIPDRRCIECHPLPLTKGNARYPHKARNALVGCGGCHAHTGHQLSVQALSGAGIMSQRSRVKFNRGIPAPGPVGHPQVVCNQCHDLHITDCMACHRPRHQNWGECTQCHPKGSWAFSHPAVREHNWRKFACVKCHPKGFRGATCKVCHPKGAPKGD